MKALVKPSVFASKISISLILLSLIPLILLSRTAYHQTGIQGLSDNNEVWSDILSDQRIRRESKGLSCICLVECKSDHDVRSMTKTCIMVSSYSLH